METIDDPKLLKKIQLTKAIKNAQDFLKSAKNASDIEVMRDEVCMALSQLKGAFAEDEFRALEEMTKKLEVSIKQARSIIDESLNDFANAADDWLT